MRHSLRNQAPIHFALGVSTKLLGKHTHCQQREEMATGQGQPLQLLGAGQGPHSSLDVGDSITALTCPAPACQEQLLLPYPPQALIPPLSSACHAPGEGLLQAGNVPNPSQTRVSLMLIQSSRRGFLGSLSSFLYLQTSASQQPQRGPCRSAGGSVRQDGCPAVVCALVLSVTNTMSPALLRVWGQGQPLTTESLKIGAIQMPS